MNPVEDTYPGTEREWDSFTIIRADFRPHWNGDLVSLSTLVQPRLTLSETATFATECARQIAGWVLANRQKFGPNDRFGIIVAWPLSVRTTKRRIIKIGCTYQDIDEISSHKRSIPLRDGWSTGIFP